MSADACWYSSSPATRESSDMQQQQADSGHLNDQQLAKFAQVPQDSHSFAEALLFAQSRAREAEQVLYSYDTRMEEVVLRALTLLDSSRHKEELCQQRLQALKQAAVEEEERCALELELMDARSHPVGMQGEMEDAMDDCCEDALNKAVMRGLTKTSVEDWQYGCLVVAAAPDADAVSPEALVRAKAGCSSSSSALLQGAYEKLLSATSHATKPASAASTQPKAGCRETARTRQDNLWVRVAEAYSDLKEAQDVTQRHVVLLEELEMLVEPVLQYRHRGVYDAHRYCAHDAGGDGGRAESGVYADDDGGPGGWNTDGGGGGWNTEGSSVVFVNAADGLQDEEADGSRGCFPLVAAKVRSEEEVRRYRAVLLRVQQALEKVEWVHAQQHPPAATAATEHTNSTLGEGGGTQAGCGGVKGVAGVAGALGVGGVDCKVASLITLVESQRQDIEQLRQDLAAARGVRALAAEGEARECERAECPDKQAQMKAAKSDYFGGGGCERAHATQGVGLAAYADAVMHACSVRSARRVDLGRARYVHEFYPRDILEYSAFQAHVFVDFCEDTVVRSIAVALELFDQVLRCLSLSVVPVVWSMQELDHKAVIQIVSSPPYSSMSSLSSCSYSCETDAAWWWPSADNLYNVYC